MPKIEGGIETNRFIRWLREQGFSFKTQTPRRTVWVKAGASPVLVPRRSQLEEGFVWSELRHFGLGQAQIESVIAALRI